MVLPANTPYGLSDVGGVLIVDVETDRCEDGDLRDLVRSMNVNRSAPSSCVAVS